MSCISGQVTNYCYILGTEVTPMQYSFIMMMSFLIEVGFVLFLFGVISTLFDTKKEKEQELE